MVKLADYSIAIVMLAAGSGRRMRLAETSKLLLPAGNGQTLIGRALRSAAAWQPSAMVVVVQPDSAAIAAEVSMALMGVPDIPVNIVENPRHEEGLGTSLAVGVAALGDEIGVALVLLGDMPFVSANIIEKLVAAHIEQASAIVIPEYGGKVGPPTLFSRAVFVELRKLSGDVGGRQLVQTFPDRVRLVPFGADERPLDVDTPEDLARIESQSKVTTVERGLLEINNLNQAEFVSRLGFLFEGSPWVAERTWAKRPFHSFEELHNALCAEMYGASLDYKLGLINAHPDLVGKAALEGTLTRHSTGEQASAGLDSLSADEVVKFSRLNGEYRERFGFPFIICVRENKKESILAGFATRLNNSREQEIDTALAEIAKIARLRLLDTIQDDAPLED